MPSIAAPVPAIVTVPEIDPVPAKAVSGCKERAPNTVARTPRAVLIAARLPLETTANSLGAPGGLVSNRPTSERVLVPPWYLGDVGESARKTKKAPFPGPSPIAGAGFEPATFGL